MKAAKKVISRVVRAILILALVAGTVPSAAAQSAKAKANGAATPAKSQTAAKPTGGPQEAIKVHGHWVIEVRNPDGTLATRREFNNALADSRVLVLLLSRQLTPGPWAVGLFANTGTTAPCAAGGQNSACGLYEGAPVQTLSGFATATTALTMTTSLTPPVRLQLQGTVTATADSTITGVITAITNCSATLAPATSCANGSTSFSVFTEAAGSAFTPVHVVPGQIIQVTVSFSFS